MTASERRALEAVAEQRRMSAERLARLTWPTSWKRLARAKQGGRTATLVRNAAGLLRRLGKAGFVHVAFEPPGDPLVFERVPTFEISAAGRNALGDTRSSRTLRDAITFLNRRRCLGRAIVTALLLAVCTPAARAEDGFKVGALLWGQAGMTNETSRVTWGGRISADGPVALGAEAPLRLAIDFDLAALPGESFDFGNVETFGRSAEFRGALYRRVGELDLGAQVITTSAYLECGFVTAVAGEILERYQRHCGVGVRLAEEKSGAALVVLYALPLTQRPTSVFDEGQVRVRGQVPLFGGAFVIGGDAILNVGPAGRDVYRPTVSIDPGNLIAAYRNRGKP